MIFVWLALAIGIALLAGLIELFAQEVREEHDEEIRFHKHAKEEVRAEKAAYKDAQKRKRSKQKDKK